MHGSTRSIHDQLDRMHAHQHESARERQERASQAMLEQASKRAAGLASADAEGSPDGEASTAA